MYHNTNQIRSKLLQLAQNVCGLNGMPSDTAFWSLERVILHIIQNCECGGGGNAVSNINYDKATNVLIVNYSDTRPTKNIQLTDKYLNNVTVDTANQLIQFIMNDGENLSADLSVLFDEYYDKAEVDTIAEDNLLVWGSF